MKRIHTQIWSHLFGKYLGTGTWYGRPEEAKRDLTKLGFRVVGEKPLPDGKTLVWTVGKVRT